MTEYAKRKMLTRFEVAKIVGIRAVQLSEGSHSHVDIESTELRNDHTYVASLELYRRMLDVCVKRGNNLCHVNDVEFPVDLLSYLNTRDGGNRRLYESCSQSLREDSLTSKDNDSRSKESFSS